MGTRRIVVGALGAVLVGAVLLGGCAQGSGQGAQPGDSMSATPSSPPPGPLPSGLSLPPSPPEKSAGPLTLTGMVEAGVERGCLLLKDGGKTYLLMGGDPGVVYAGARVRISGRVNTSLMSYCMQGTPFQVSEAHSA